MQGYPTLYRVFICVNGIWTHLLCILCLNGFNIAMFTISSRNLCHSLRLTGIGMRSSRLLLWPNPVPPVLLCGFSLPRNHLLLHVTYASLTSYSVARYLVIIFWTPMCSVGVVTLTLNSLPKRRRFQEREFPQCLSILLNMGKKSVKTSRRVIKLRYTLTLFGDCDITPSVLRGKDKVP